MRVAERKNVPLTAVCTSGSVKNVASWMVTTTGRPDPQRHRVVRRVDDLGLDLLATSGRPVCSQASRAGRWAIAAGPGTIVALRRQPRVALGVGPLADDREVGVAPHQRRDQAVDVAADAATVSRDGGCVDEHAGIHSAPSQLVRSRPVSPAKRTPMALPYGDLW